MQVISLRAAVIAAAVAAPAAQASEALQVAKRLVVGSGLAVQLKSFPRQIEQDLEQAQGRMPDYMLDALRAAARESYRPAVLQDDIVQAVAQRLTVAEMRKALLWLDSDTGRRMTRAEELASDKMTPQAIQAYAEGMQRRPLSAKRSEIIAALVASTNAVESTLSVIEGMALGVAIGMDSMQPVQKRIGVSALRAQLRKSMPPDKMRAEIGALTPILYAYTYRDASDADLAAYLDFNRSSSGARYNDAVMGALAEALAKASLRVGAAVDSALHRKAA